MKVTDRRSGIKIMAALIGLVKPLLHIMCLAILLGTAGYLCASFLTILAAQILVGNAGRGIIGIIILLAVLRGVLHYGEQYCNHFIAFKILAIIRHKVFAVLRKLCPAKLEGREKGNLISIITTDIELLEVFYAHTVSPIAIAVLTSVVMILFIGHHHFVLGLLAAMGYAVVGIILPLVNGKAGAADGIFFRNKFGELNSFVLDSLRGMDETIQYEQGKNRIDCMNVKSQELGRIQNRLNRLEGSTRGFTNLAILVFSFAMLFLSLFFMREGKLEYADVVTATVAMLGSFGPVVALANLSNNLNQTLASGERVLSLLEEAPLVEEVLPTEKVGELDVLAGNGRSMNGFTGAKADKVTFAYEEERILKDYSITIKPGTIVGLHGRSGSGKSTLLKLFMRFWDVNAGVIKVAEEDVRKIATQDLRNMESYVTQETQLFHDSIYKNIAIAKENATIEEVIDAAKKASIHEFIMTLPKQYNTEVGELGDTLSGGEKQRIGLARAFLHNAPFMLLDEPTSNLDSMNEAVILKSLYEAREDKTVLIVSHRESTLRIADVTYQMESGSICMEPAYSGDGTV